MNELLFSSDFATGMTTCSIQMSGMTWKFLAFAKPPIVGDLWIRFSFYLLFEKLQLPNHSKFVQLSHFLIFLLV